MLIPPDWEDVFASKGKERTARAIDRLEGAVGVELRETIQFLRSHLQTVELLREGGTVSLLYSISSGKGKNRYWIGGLPIGMTHQASVSFTESLAISGGSTLDWAKVPASLKRLYGLHNGFRYFTHGFGFPRISEIFCFGDQDLGIIEALDLDVPLDLSQTYDFFSNGAGGCLGVDLTHCEDDKAVLWWAKDAPTYDVNFWDVVDEWILMNLSEAE